MTPDAVPLWHALEATAAAVRLRVDPAVGLSEAEAAERLRRYGANAVQDSERRGPLAMVAAQFADFMILLLVGAAVISGVIGDIEDAVVILAIVLLNALIGFIQEFRAARTMAALKRLAPQAAVVRRDGRLQTVRAEALVPGDILQLEAGNTVPADVRLIDAVDLQIDESMLTGESVPVEKILAPLADTALPLGDRRNLAFKGTAVLRGRAGGVVIATGMATEFGRIAGMLHAVGDVRTPLQRRLAQLGRRLAVAAVAICVLIFGIGLLRGEPPLLMALTALSLAVAAVPEALPAVVTVLLALGARRMARAQALIRRLPAVETLGSVTTICTDKTGTLTLNTMRATEAVIAGRRLPISAVGTTSAGELLRAMALCNDVAAGGGTALGDPTEIALWRAAAEAGVDKAEQELTAPRVGEVPFDSDRKRMTTLHATDGGCVAYVKGAPESIVPRCTRIAVSHGDAPLDAATVTAAADAMAEDGLRVLALATRHWPEPPSDRSADALECNLVLLGLIGLIDPPRPEAAAAVAECRKAGITPVMITGDHPATARAIARQIGLLDETGEVLSGPALTALPDHELLQRAPRIRVYARVDPAQKIRIVTALQECGDIVAMTGDGVNDAPALAKADIGVAMGRTGTDVAREAASLVLLDDNYATIVTAAREGRRIYDNIRKFVRFVVTCNSAEIWTIFLAPFFGLPVPLLPIHILWINLVTDGLPGLALAAEPAESDVMRRPPRSPREGLFAQGMMLSVIWVGLLMAGVTLLTQAVALRSGDMHWQSMVFTVLTLAQMWQIMAIRSEHRSLFQLGLLSNKPLLGAVVLTFALQLGVLYLPVCNEIFDTAPLTLGELAVCIAASSTVFFAVEAEKWWTALSRRGYQPP